MQERILITMKENPDVILRAFPGHFITPTAHSNYYLDMTAIKSRTHESRAAAVEFAKNNGITVKYIKDSYQKPYTRISCCCS